MNTFNSDIPLLIDDQPYNFAFDGQNGYFTVQDKIIKTDGNFRTSETFAAKRHYDRICYDRNDQCFWASTKYCPGVIFKLSSGMTEIDRICLFRQKSTSGVITGLSLDGSEDALMASFTNCIVKVDKRYETAEIQYTAAGMCITSVLCICPGFIITGIKERKQYVFIMDEVFTTVHSWPVDSDVIIRSVCFNPYFVKFPEICLEFLVEQKGCYPYVYRRMMHACDLGFLPCRCNYEICKCEDRDCHKDCRKDILESIAKEEASISDILNAEGEKIKKVIAVSDDADEILCVNREVNKTIINVTHLEQVLYSKLAALNECCDFCPPVHHCGSCKKKDSCNDCEFEDDEDLLP